jgi:hypothetical protein
VPVTLEYPGKQRVSQPELKIKKNKKKIIIKKKNFVRPSVPFSTTTKPTVYSQDNGQCDNERLHILAHPQRATIQLQKQVVTESTRPLKSTRQFISDVDEISFSRSDPIRYESQTERKRSMVVRAVASLQRLWNFFGHKKFAQRFTLPFQVKMGFGLHIGWAIACAVNFTPP